MKNRKLIIFLVIGLVVLIGGGVLVLSSNKQVATVQEVAEIPVEEKVSVVKPEEIGLVLSATSDNRRIILEVTNTQGLSGLDYELSYTSKGDIPRGVIGHIDVRQPGKSVRQEITLGTCSDVCHYDENVSDVKLILKVSKTDGTTSQVEKSLEL